MVKNEVEIMDEGHDEYEVIPLTPIRRLEKRMEKMEGSRSMSNLERLMDKIIDMVELNQRIVDEMVKSNQSLREDLYSLVGKMDDLQKKIGNFIDIVSEAGKEEGEEAVVKSIIETTVKPLMEKMVETNNRLLESNTTIAESLDSLNKKLKRPPTTPANLLKPIGSISAPTTLRPSNILMQREK